MPQTKVLAVEVPRHLHVVAKLYSAEHGVSLRVMVERALADWLRSRGAAVPTDGATLSELDLVVKEAAVALGPDGLRAHLEEVLRARAASAA